MLTDSRTDLKELNEINFARFDAKLEQRLSEIRGELRVLSANIELKLAEQTAVIEKRLGEQSAAIQRTLQDQNRMLIAAWGVLMASMVALWLK